MTLTLSFTARRWELHLALLTQLEYWPVLSRWRGEFEYGFIFRILCLVFRFGADAR